MPGPIGMMLDVLAMGGGGFRTITQPAGIVWALPFSVQTNGATFRADPAWDISAQVSRAGGTRYVAKGGSNAAAGTSWETAWATLLYALANTPDGGVIYIGAGKYGWDDGGVKSTLNNKTLSFIGVGDVILDGYLANPGWSLAADQTVTYQATENVEGHFVFDYAALDSNGDPANYTKLASVAAVENTAGSWWWDDPNDLLYVHTLDDRVPDADIRFCINWSYSVGVTADGKSVYAENIKSYGNSNLVANSSVAGGTTGYFKDCRFMFQTGGSLKLFSVTGADAFFQNCQFAHNSANDGLYGSVKNTLPAKIVEIDCEGWDVGPASGTAWNASTNHNSGYNLIINGVYHTTGGPIMGYVSNSYAWLLGCYAHGSISSNATWNVNYFFETAGAWLDSCRGDGSTKNFNVTAGYTIYVHNFIGTVDNAGSGTISTY